VCVCSSSTQSSGDILQTPNELPRSLEGAEFLGKLSDYQFLRRRPHNRGGCSFVSCVYRREKPVWLTNLQAAGTPAQCLAGSTRS
jgi:hypothetical protein